MNKITIGQIARIVFFTIVVLSFLPQDIVSPQSGSPIEQPSGSIWPDIYQYKELSGYLLSEEKYFPTLIPSTEEAITTIKSFPKMVIIIPFIARTTATTTIKNNVGIPIDVDKDNLKLGVKWTQQEIISEGTYTHTLSTSMEKECLIPFKDVTDLDCSQTNVFQGFVRVPSYYVIITLKRTAEDKELLELPWGDSGPDKKRLWIQAKTKKDMKLLANAIYTLSHTTPKQPGFSVAGLTPEQANELGLNYGVLVTGVIENKPAYKAGIKFIDVILELNGIKITDKEQFENQLYLISLEGEKTMTVKLLRWAEYKEEKLKNIVRFTYILKRDNMVKIQDLKPRSNREEKIVEIKWE